MKSNVYAAEYFYFFSFAYYFSKAYLCFSADRMPLSA